MYLHTPPNTKSKKLLLSGLSRACTCIFVFSFLLLSYPFLAGVKTGEYNNYLKFEFYASVHIRLNHFNSNEHVKNADRLR